MNDISGEHSLPLGQSAQQALAALTRSIRGVRRPIVAFSGGIDSSLVAYLSHRVHGPAMLAVTSASASLSRADLALTRTLSAQWQMPHLVIETDELGNPSYRANPPGRCYVCKQTLFGALRRLARLQGYDDLLSGTNWDDLSDARPGLQAAQEYGVKAPLLDCKLGKTRIKGLARLLGLPNADKPQAACLASRVPHGTPIDAALLARIEACEAAIGALGFTMLRVRHHGELARIELHPAEFPRAIALQETLVRCCRQNGYRFVTLDLQGYRQGSLVKPPTQPDAQPDAQSDVKPGAD